MHGEHTIKAWSKTQAMVALSSGGSELYATVKATAEGLGVQSIFSDLGRKVDGHVWGDASAALGIINRTGLGKLRHINTSYLWIQDITARRCIEFSKILGTENPADLFTKHLSSRERVQMLVGLLGCRYTSGRAESAPMRRTGLQSGRVTMAEANSLEDEKGHHLQGLRAIMPHLEHPDRRVMDELYPPLTAAEDVDDQGEINVDKEDVVYQQGLKIVEDIRHKLITNGRRRVE